MITPELNQYITSLNGENFKGLIFLLFGFGALIIRPLSGKLADTIGRIPVMIVGSVVGMIAGIAYPIFSSLTAFFILRFLHGFSSGFKPTGTTAFLSDLIPTEHRGQAMGYLGMAGSTGMAAGPYVGSFIALNFSVESMFHMSSLMAFLSLITVLGMKESLVEKEKFSLKTLRIPLNSIYTFDVWLPSLIMFLSIFSFGTILVIIPDLHDKLNIENRGSFMLYMVLSSIIVRYYAGQISDKYGRIFALKFGMGILTIGMIATSLSYDYYSLMIAGIICGISVGINSPTIFAWTIDLANDNKKGPAISTMLSALEIGIIFSTLFSSLIYNNNTENIIYTFLLSSLIAFFGFIILFIVKEK